MIKPSRYNIAVPLDDGNILVANTLTQQQALLASEEYAALQSLHSTSTTKLVDTGAGEDVDCNRYAGERRLR